jgi:phage baseplate assembly protein W
MSIDFFLDNHGDISFETAPQEELEQFTFNFHYATSDSLLFNFFTEINGKKERTPEMLQFNFNTYSVLNDKQNKLISGDDFIKQAIKIQLETELGTIRGSGDIGCNLFRYKHMFMNEEEVINTITQVVSDAVKVIVPNSEVKVYMQKTAYYDFYNAIKIAVIFLDKIMWFTL